MPVTNRCASEIRHKMPQTSWVPTLLLLKIDVKHKLMTEFIYSSLWKPNQAVYTIAHYTTTTASHPTSRQHSHSPHPNHPPLPLLLPPHNLANRPQLCNCYCDFPSSHPSTLNLKT